MTQDKNIRLRVVKIIFIFTILVFSLLLYVFRKNLGDIKVYGYPGVFLVSLISNSTVFFPVPGIAAVTAAGAFLNPVYLALFAGLGGALGEVTGYMIGFSGTAFVEKKETYKKYENYIQKYGFLPIIFLSTIPNPLFDIAGITAGVLKIPLWKFILAAWIGITIKMFLFAFLGLKITELVL
ncbi:MAG: VTT domain-containing protein [Patescibacteria group bacterium]|nr:VTT domain-containing protein [Patescibacteria group bacterium]